MTLQTRKEFIEEHNRRCHPQIEGDPGYQEIRTRVLLHDGRGRTTWTIYCLGCTAHVDVDK